MKLRRLTAVAALVAVLVAAWWGPAAFAADLRHDNASGLDYVEVITAGGFEADPLPVVLAIHGLGDNPESFRLLLDDLPAKARVVLPRGPIPYKSEGFSWFEFHSSDDAEGARALAVGITAAAESLARLLVSLGKTYGGPPRAVVCGFSQGGMLSFALAASHPELVAAAVPVSGYLPSTLWPASPPKTRPLPKILALHGEADPLIALQLAHWSVDALRINGFDTTLKSWPGVGHALSPQMHAALLAAVVDAVEPISLPGTVESGPPPPAPWAERKERGSEPLPPVDDVPPPLPPIDRAPLEELPAGRAPAPESAQAGAPSDAADAVGTGPVASPSGDAPAAPVPTTMRPQDDPEGY